MSKDNINMTLDELEVLSQAYLDCRLSKLQEKELQLVLESTDISSPVIDEVRETMGITSVWEGMNPIYPVRKKSMIRTVRWVVAAACLALVAVVAGRFVTSGSTNPGMLQNEEYIVYIDGKCLDPDEAKKIALETQASYMAQLHQALRQAEEQENECLKMINNSQIQ